MRARDLAIDLGTANTVIYERGRGVVLDEPSVVAVRAGTSQLLAAGHRAKEMLGRTPDSVTAVRPLRDGVISDADVTERMLRWFVDQVAPSRVFRPRIVVCVPSDITSVERRALEDSTLRAGARRVHVIEEPMAAAIGAGLPIEETNASMVVDLGGGTTNVAVISLGGIVTSRSVRVGGDEVDEAIIAHVKSEYALLLGERSAEQIKVAVGSAFPLREELSERVRGRDLVTGLPKTVSISSVEVRRAIEAPVLRPSSLATSSTAASPSPAAGRSCAGWPNACITSSACRSSSPTIRCGPSREVLASVWRSSTPCIVSSSTTVGCEGRRVRPPPRSAHCARGARHRGPRAGRHRGRARTGAAAARCGDGAGPARARSRAGRSTG